jgi:cholesterol transport system auxiliary component
MKNFISIFLISIFIATNVSGCFSAGAKNTVVYSPRPIATETNAEAPVQWQLRIENPDASDFLDSTRIAVRRENNTLQVFEGARWADSVPEMLQGFLTQHFNDSGRITTVSGLDNNTASDAMLLLDIRQFEAVYTDADSSAAAVISVQAKIQSHKTNRIVASKHFFISIPADNKKIPQVMKAFETAMQQASQEILQWALTADVPSKK